MGVYDRPYYHDDQQGQYHPSAWPLVGQLIALNVALFFANLLLFRATREYVLLNYLVVDDHLWSRPWLGWRLLTYGFVHDPSSLGHIFFNMLGLYFFGTPVEQRFGRRETLALFLASIVVAGLAWLVAENLDPARGGNGSVLLGASGAVMALMIVFVYHNPKATILVFGVLPVVAWVFALVYVLMDLYGAISPGGSPVAYVAHLGGAAFGWLYCRQGWQLGGWLPDASWLTRLKQPSRWLRRRPKLNLVDPSRDDQSLQDEVDRILDKINRSGEASLTKAERRKLEEASRRYQQRRL